MKLRDAGAVGGVMEMVVPNQHQHRYGATYCVGGGEGRHFSLGTIDCVPMQS